MRALRGIVLLAAVFPGAWVDPAGARALAPAPLPERLADTGLYAPGSTTQVRSGIQAYTPQYPLWSDGARKRRWLSLPPGTAIDASDPDAWDFPRGTRIWKEFAHERPVETRYIERLVDGTWRFASYVWNETGTDARLASEWGMAKLPAPGAPGGTYAIPSRTDCLACHGGAPVPVLGIGALQLSPDRDPQAPNAEPVRPGDADLPRLVAMGWVKGLPKALLAAPPRVAGPPRERAALGYLHGNCGHCHNRGGPAGDAAVPVDLALAQRVGGGAPGASVRSLLAASTRFRAETLPAEARLLAPGDADHSILPWRMRTRDPLVRMPPLGTRVPDAEAIALIDAWIDHDLHPDRKDRP
jgi:hypothetical protein